MDTLPTQNLTYIAVVAHPDGRMDAANAARYLGLSVKTLANLRSRGSGPRFIKRGKIFYQKDALDAWLAETASRSTAEARCKLGGRAA